MLPAHFTAAPFYYSKSCSFRSVKFLFRYLLPAVCRLIRHKHTDYRIRLRFNNKSGMLRISLCLERNQVVRIGFQPGQPVYNKLIGLPAGKSQLPKRFFQKLCGILSRDAESFRKIILPVGGSQYR